MKHITTCIIIFQLLFNIVIAQVINKDAYIRINENANLIIKDVNFENYQNGTIDNDGLIVMNGGNWKNEADNNVFVNLNDKGEVKFSGLSEKSISGKTKTLFENLTNAEGIVKLEITDCEVIEKLSLIDNSVFKLNLNKIIINNKNTSSVYADESAYILSEQYDYDYKGDNHNDKVYGEFQWNIGDNTGTYLVPFGTESEKNLYLTLKINNSGSPATGNLVFATYPTNIDNMPLSTIVNSLENLHADDISDRYWKIQANYSSKPSVDITFKYGEKDVQQDRNPGLVKEKLLALRYNTSLNTWLDIAAKGSSDANKQTVKAEGIGASDFYQWWTLTVKSKLETTNIITPNNDGHNDVFIPDLVKDKNGNINPDINSLQGIISLNGKIFNRWGNLIYEWSGENWWDGKYNGNEVTDGTYYYVIDAKGSDGVKYNEKGTVTVLRK